MTYQLFVGNNLEILPTLPDNSIDSIVTDPPYGLSDNKFVADTIARWIAGERDFVPDGKGFMGKAWDAFVPPPALWDECLRVLKPGGYLLSFFGSRTQDIGALAIRLAGFEIRDSIAWLYGSGFPKSLNLKGEWQGWGTALKPAFEPIVVARKPIEGTVANNVLKWGTGGLNIDGSRIGRAEGDVSTGGYGNGGIGIGSVGLEQGEGKNAEWQTSTGGRWPANIILDPYTAELLDEQSGTSKSTPTKAGGSLGSSNSMSGGLAKAHGSSHNDSGGASRFFYVVKASKRDRNEGLDELEIKRPDTRSSTGMGTFEEKGVQPQRNFHPTVKPTTLMEYLVKLVTPPNGTVLDPFTGSGSTGKAAILQAFNFIGIEMTQEYVPIIEGRLKHAEKTVAESKKQETLKETEKLF